MVITLIGNKSDLGSQRKVSFEEGKQFAEEHGLANFFETSAKSNSGVSQLFHDVARRLLSTKARSADAMASGGLPPLPDPLAPDADRRRGKCC